MKWKLPVVLLVVVAASVGVALNGWSNTKNRAKDLWTRLTATAASAGTMPGTDRRVSPGASPWDGLIAIDTPEAHSIGLVVVDVKPQTEPMHLEVNGATAYDPNTQSKVRPKFPSLIDKVYVEQGQRVAKGDPLVDLFSPDLAAAKSDYEVKKQQWLHDQTEFARAEGLYKLPVPAISQKEFLNIQNDEKQSNVKQKVARDVLVVYGLTDSEIEGIASETGAQKAKMTLRSPASGVVIQREAVEGNRYDITDTLLVIAPLDHFWVWGNVYPSDASRVSIGQDWVIDAQFIQKTVRTKVEAITSDIDKDSKTVRIRTRIDNLGGRLKADMLVSGYLEIPATQECTVIPRQAMVSTDGADYVFVRRTPESSQLAKFERRPIQVRQEYHDQVIVNGGLKAGEKIAARGSLILSQMYEDAATIGSAPTH
jgi:cobalt-zinc-cadmium efflux system membrane fusion protein